MSTDPFESLAEERERSTKVMGGVSALGARS